MSSEIGIRVATPLDTEGFIEWGKLEGWNMGLYDVPANYKDYPEGWFIAENSESPLGKLYCVKYPSGVGHIGYIIVDEKFRGMGVGSKLLKHAIQYLSTTASNEVKRLVSLYSAGEEEPFYNKLGFKVVKNVTRMILSGSKLIKMIPQDVPVLNDNVEMALINPIQDLDSICTFDATLSGCYRRKFWSLYGTTLGNKACVVCKSKSTGNVIGLGAIRPFQESWRMGPIYADNSTIAEAIIGHLLTCNAQIIQKGSLLVDTFDSNVLAADLLKKLGFTYKSSSFLLVKHADDASKHQMIHPSCQNVDKIFCIASLDFN